MIAIAILVIILKAIGKVRQVSPMVFTDSELHAIFGSGQLCLRTHKYKFDAASQINTQEFQGESNMHQIVATVSCHICPPFSRRGTCRFPVLEERPVSMGSHTYFYRISCMNSLFSPTGNLGPKGDAKWWTSIRCMFDSFRELTLRNALFN